jgi:hypothetical protein
VKEKSDNCPTLLQTLTPEQLVATDGVYVCSQNVAGLRTTSPNLFCMNCNGSSQSLLEEVVWIDRYTLHTLFLVSSTLGNLCPHSQICFFLWHCHSDSDNAKLLEESHHIDQQAN